jgi:hypothetical protein
MFKCLKNKKVMHIVLLAIIVVIIGLVFFKREGYDLTPEDELNLTSILNEEGITDEQDRAFVMTKLKSFPSDQNAMRELNTKFPELLKSEKVGIFIEQVSARNG